jgi:TolB protein
VAITVSCQNAVLFMRNSDIWAADPGGGAPVQLTSGPGMDAEPEWFPGGKKIVFSRAHGSNADIFVMADDGSNIQQLTTNPAIDTSPAVSPDGQKIAFASNRGPGQNWDIWVMNIDGSSPQRMTTHASEDLLPAWSPNSKKIAFMSNRTGNGDIYKLAVIAPATTQVRLTTGPTASDIDAEPAWFGSRIAFSSNRVANNNFEIFTIPSGGGSATRLTTQAGHDVTPSWSQDGAKIAFASNRLPQGGGRNFNIWTMDADGNTGSQQPLVVNSGVELFPDW